MDNGLSVNQARVLAHNPPSPPSKLQGKIPPFPSSSKDLRQAMRPSLRTKLYGSYLEHLWSISRLKIETGFKSCGLPIDERFWLAAIRDIKHYM